MAFKDRIAADIEKVFINLEHFAETHTINGVPFECVVDEEEALKRKNNNVNDISWDNNTRDILIYTPVKEFPMKPVPNATVLFDNKSMRILQVNEDKGMYSIMLVAKEGREY